MAILFKVAYELKKPWHKRMYDVVGVVGQLFGMRWMNVPSLNYCSERVVKLVKVIFPDYKNNHPTPEDIDALFKKSDRMVVMGYWAEV